MAYRAQIPYGTYWSTPFAKWQGSLANLNSLELAAHVAKRELEKRSIAPETFDYGVLGMTVPQHHSFYGMPWLMGLIGAGKVGGPTINQACATGTRALLTAAQEIESGLAETALVVTCDRTSNGPHVYYPSPKAPGGTGGSEDWVLDNFSCDPLGRHAMIDTAENVAGKHQISTEQQHALVLRRQAQYQDALADDRAFQKRYMTLPFDVPAPNYRKVATTVEGDEGIVASNEEGLAKLRPVREGGSVTYGAQTHPADGSAAVVVTTPERARDLSSDPKVAVELLGFGLARTELAFMPEATVPSAKRALDQAGLTIADMDAVKSHNPFAVNDIVFAKETGADLEAMNNYGCPLIWGHPQGPTALRAIIELIEELALRGGGTGLFEGCAAGDTAMAAVVRVGDR
ncbi:MAG: thiolase family protein [Rhodospirillales bacterium]|nr:thiolase family protein [Rhodospirillales bacterium]MDH3790200.1 thiolase family protein [Rhodospirillales bacterium]MDH3913497.1 thiolase family protein [Rhodospirillales bacterium]MDH3968167.1 thiolase family protein [Rhodospirillales bacterium]